MSSDCWVGGEAVESKTELTATIAISILGGQAGSQ